MDAKAKPRQFQKKFARAYAKSAREKQTQEKYDEINDPFILEEMFGKSSGGRDEKAMLARHIQAKSNPAWYLELLGIALEDSQDMDQALRVADRAYLEIPQPPAKADTTRKRGTQ